MQMISKLHITALTRGFVTVSFNFIVKIDINRRIPLKTSRYSRRYVRNLYQLPVDGEVISGNNNLHYLKRF